MTIPDSLRELLATGPHAQVITLDPDGTPHVTLEWAGFDGDEVVMATFDNVNRRKIRNMRRDPRLGVCFVDKDYSTRGLHPYAVIEGRARISEGGALAVMDRLAEHYIGPGELYPTRDVPDGLVIHVRVDRVYGQGPWRDTS